MESRDRGCLDALRFSIASNHNTSLGAAMGSKPAAVGIARVLWPVYRRRGRYFNKLDKKRDPPMKPITLRGTRVVLLFGRIVSWDARRMFRHFLTSVCVLVK
jgi:hypothetical protein